MKFICRINEDLSGVQQLLTFSTNSFIFEGLIFVGGVFIITLNSPAIDLFVIRMKKLIHVTKNHSKMTKTKRKMKRILNFHYILSLVVIIN